MSQKESCHGYHSDKAEEEEEDDENVTRSDLVSEVVPSRKSAGAAHS
jgi:hypothetical protein